MQITKELFVIPKEDDFILYAPLKGIILEVNSDMIALLKKIEAEEDISGLEETILSLKEKGILVEEEEPISLPIPNEFKPTHVTLMPTLDCNLRCIYCFSEGGENPTPRMSWSITKASIDLIVANAIETKKGLIHLGFHGGGEPLLEANRDLVTRATEYVREQAKKNDLKSNVSSATNAMLSPDYLRWVITNFDRLNISLDGPPDIQDAQRPMANGKPSSKKVLRTIQALEEAEFDYGIRATITRESVERMPEIVEYFTSISSTKSFHLEPLFECGRCSTTNSKAPDPEDFVKYMIQAREKAEELGVSIRHAGSDLEKVSNVFCGAAGRNFFVTPPGDVTACLEVCRPEDSRAKIFYIGQYNSETESFDFMEDRISGLRKRTVDKIPHCQDCYTKFSCAGDCLAKVQAETQDLYDTSSNPRCEVSKGLMLHEIETRLKKENEN